MIEQPAILGRKILVITAHPDDESFLAAGTIYANSQAGGQTFLVCATLGEKGKSHLKVELTEEQLSKVRQQELRTAAALLGVQKVFELGFPDGELDQHQGSLRDKTSVLLHELQPDLIMSFGPGGITGHRDHIAAGKVAKQLAQNHQLPLAAFCLPKQVKDEAREWLIKRRHSHHHYEDDFTLADENAAIQIHADIKIQALKCYDSQIDEAQPFAGFPEHIAAILLKQESFYVQKPNP